MKGNKMAEMNYVLFSTNNIRGRGYESWEFSSSTVEPIPGEAEDYIKEYTQEVLVEEPEYLKEMGEEMCFILFNKNTGKSMVLCSEIERTIDISISTLP
jgi:hypothetical protein